MAFKAAIRKGECIISGLRPQLLGTAIATLPAKVL